MSKSLGNGIDPLEMADQYGADALRFNLVTGNSPGNDMRFYTERCEAMRNFANKIWNASRFLMMNLTIDRCELPEQLELEDKWILSKLNCRHPRGHREHGALRAGRGRPEGVRLHLGLLLRLVYRADQDPPAGRRTRTARSGAQQVLLLCAHRDPQAAAPLHALHHRGDLAGPAPRGRLPDAPAVAAAPTPSWTSPRRRRPWS